MASKTDWGFQQQPAIFFLIFIPLAQAYYCDNDKCTEEEYCCGDNTCCPSYKVWDLWYFWCGVLFFIFLLSLCACLWRYRFLSNGAIMISGYSYSPLQDVNSMGTRPNMPSSHGYSRSHNQLYTPPLGTPPPYNQISAGNVKIAAPPPSYAQVVGMRESH